MTAQQRVLAVFERRAADRVPRYEIFLPGFIEKWKLRYPEHAARGIYDFYRSIDIGMVLPDQHGPYYGAVGIVKDDGDGYVERDSWGRLVSRKRSGYFENVLAVLPISPGGSTS